MSGVLHVITGLGLGGAESVLARTVLAARAAGAPQQTVVSLMDEGAYGADLRAGGVEVHCLGMRRGVPSPGALFQLTRIMRKKRPDAIMSWLYHADLAATLAARLSGLGARRVVWNLRCADMDFSKYPRSTRWIVSALARLSHLPAAVVANSHAGRAHHEKLGYRPRRWVDLPNGFDLENWRPDALDRASVRAELGLGDHEIAAGMVARVDPMKDHATFLAAAAMLALKFPAIRFVLVGKDTETFPVQSALSGKVIALGERKDVSRIIRGLDIAVLCSLSEGFPNVVGEAMASGLPCVATDVGDSAKIISGSGETVALRSPDALADAMARIIQEGPDARRRRGEAARGRIAENFSLDQIVGLYRKLWDEISQSPR